MARKRGGLRTSVYQGADHWSILFRNGQIFRSLSIILKNSRCPTFILNALSTTVTRRHSLKRTLGFSKRCSNRVCS
jgi:hypothetical protein